jgi:hypothetical protein
MGAVCLGEDIVRLIKITSYRAEKETQAINDPVSILSVTAEKLQPSCLTGYGASVWASTRQTEKTRAMDSFWSSDNARRNGNNPNCLQ